MSLGIDLKGRTRSSEMIGNRGQTTWEGAWGINVIFRGLTSSRMPQGRPLGKKEHLA